MSIVTCITPQSAVQRTGGSYLYSGVSSSTFGLLHSGNHIILNNSLDHGRDI